MHTNNLTADETPFSVSTVFTTTTPTVLGSTIHTPKEENSKHGVVWARCSERRCSAEVHTSQNTVASGEEEGGLETVVVGVVVVVVVLL